MIDIDKLKHVRIQFRDGRIRSQRHDFFMYTNRVNSRPSYFKTYKMTSYDQDMHVEDFNTGFNALDILQKVREKYGYVKRFAPICDPSYNNQSVTDAQINDFISGETVLEGINYIEIW